MEKYEPDFTEESKALGYYPFIRFSPLEWQTFVRLYGDWTFSVVLPKLRDPSRVYPGWASKFMGTVMRLPADEVLASENLHAFVTISDFFKVRRKYYERFKAAFAYGLRDFPVALSSIDEAKRPIFMADYERWQEVFQRRTESSAKQREDARLKAERRAAHKAAEEAARKKKEAEAEAEKKAAEVMPEKQKRQTLPRGPSPARKDPVIERRPVSAPVKPSSGGGWRNPNPGQTIIVRKKPVG